MKVAGNLKQWLFARKKYDNSVAMKYVRVYVCLCIGTVMSVFLHAATVDRSCVSLDWNRSSSWPSHKIAMKSIP